jgi:nitrous oxide reductase accessory protein NosL
MKKLIFALFLLVTASWAFMFQSVPESKAKLLQSGKEARYCSNCGMDLVMFYKTSHAAKVNGKQKQFCSMHCLAEVIQSGHKVSDIKVVDAKTLKWIDAKKAYYVVGSSVKGTMSKTSKYAFKNISDAKEFQHLKGGKIMNFEQALEVAKKDF